MKIIKCIAEHIAEEISDAETYIDMAAQWKEEQPDAARVFADLSAEEMGHAEKLHEIVTELIREYRDKHGDPPAGMMALTLSSSVVMAVWAVTLPLASTTNCFF